MGYKILGFVVWQAAKIFISRKFSGTTAKVAVAGVGAAIVAAVVVAGRQATSSD